MYPSLDQILDFENGEMPEEEQISFLRSLRDSGVLFTLQGFYGRAAHAHGLVPDSSGKYVDGSPYIPGQPAPGDTRGDT